MGLFRLLVFEQAVRRALLTRQLDRIDIHSPISLWRSIKTPCAELLLEDFFLNIQS